jgi:hypothetical protein
MPCVSHYRRFERMQGEVNVDKGNTFLKNGGNHLQDHRAPQSTRLQSIIVLKMTTLLDNAPCSLVSLLRKYIALYPRKMSSYSLSWEPENLQTFWTFVRLQVLTVVKMSQSRGCWPKFQRQSTWQWRQYAYVKTWSTSVRLHCAISQKAVIVMLAVMRTWTLKKHYGCLWGLTEFFMAVNMTMLFCVVTPCSLVLI